MRISIHKPQRDIAYYVAKLDELAKKFRGMTNEAKEPKQEQLLAL